MKYLLKKVLLIVISGMALSGCEKPTEEELRILDEQQVYFQYQHLNIAWGRVHKGYFIGEDGKILAYNDPEEWNSFDKNDRISAELLNENLTKATNVVHVVSSLTLRQKSRKIFDAARGELSEPESHGADMGSHCYYVLIFDPPSGNYTRYLVRQTGNIIINRNSSEAKIIGDWLEKLKNKNDF